MLKEYTNLMDKHRGMLQQEGKDTAKLATRRPSNETLAKTMIQPGNFFQTSNFDDQNHTATFQGSRKVEPNHSIDDSTSDRQIFNILTSTATLGEQ